MTNIPKSIPATMRAVVLTGHGGLERLEYRTDYPTPQPNDSEALIQVEACGLNNTDVNTRSGWYSKAVSEATTGDAYAEVSQDDPTWGGSPIRFPRIQGADIVGVVVAVGKDGDSSLLGKRVMADCWLRNWDDPTDISALGYFGSECDGGFAEYATIDYRNLRPIGGEGSPLSSAELATFSCSYTTAENMLGRAGVTSADTVLIAGASGGVGSALIQLAGRRGAKVIGMASESKHAELQKLNPTALLPRSPADLAGALAKAGIKEVSVVADIVGGDGFPTLIESLRRGGRYVCSGAIAGPIVDLDLRTFYLHDLTFFGSTATSLDVFPNLVSYIEKGEIKPLLAHAYPLAELRVAQQCFIDKKHIGNIVVTL